jgi:hypothetical protein
MAGKVSLAVLSVLVASYVIHIFRKRQKHLPPGPASYPIIGQLLSAPTSSEHLGYKRISEELKSALIIDLA